MTKQNLVNLTVPALRVDGHVLEGVARAQLNVNHTPDIIQIGPGPRRVGDWLRVEYHDGRVLDAPIKSYERTIRPQEQEGLVTYVEEWSVEVKW